MCENIYAADGLLRRNATDGHRFERQPGLPEAEFPRQSPVPARGAEGSHLPQPPAHFHRNPLGRGQFAVFPRCSLDPYDSDMGASLAP